MIYTADSQKGFTLIEVLIATVIMAIGVLGVATMHGNALFFAKDTESQWAASSSVFRIMDSMRTRLHPVIEGTLEQRGAKALALLQEYQVAAGGGVSNNCPDDIRTPEDELRCMQQDLEAALPGGRIESIIVNDPVTSGVAVSVSWLARYSGKDALAECEAMAELEAEATADGMSSGIVGGSASCANADDARRVATWVMVP